MGWKCDFDKKDLKEVRDLQLVTKMIAEQNINLLNLILERIKEMGVELDELKAAVTENTSLDDSIIQLVNGMAAQIEALKTDPAALMDLAAQLRAKSAAMSAAIQANTAPPVEPTV